MSTPDVYVEIVEDSTGQVVKRMGPMRECQAERAANGAAINLNHAGYFVQIVEAEESDDAQG